MQISHYVIFKRLSYKVLRAIFIIGFLTFFFVVTEHPIIKYNANAQSGNTCCNGPSCAGWCSSDDWCSYPGDSRCDAAHTCSAGQPSRVPCCLPGDGHNTWGNCSSSTCGTQTCIQVCGGGSGCTEGSTRQCGPSCCTVVNPEKPTLVSPANGTRDLFTTVTVDWNPISNWGKSCGTTSKNYDVQIRVYKATGTPNAWSTKVANVLDPTTTAVLTNLAWGTTYEWRVVAQNLAAGNSTASDIWRFTTRMNPILQSVTVQASSGCDNGFSGSLAYAPGNNPINIRMEMRDSYNTQSALLLLVLNPTRTTVQQLLDAGTAGGNVINNQLLSVGVDVVTGQVYTLETPGLWKLLPSSGDATTIFGNATIKGIGSATNGSWSWDAGLGQYVGVANIQIEFKDTFPNANYFVYATAASYVPEIPGYIFADSSTPGNFMFRYIRNWGVDTVSPAATISDETYQSAGTFQIAWNGSDALSGIQAIYSTVTASLDGSSIRDTTIGKGADFPYTFSDLIANTPVDARINKTTELGAHTYNDLNPALGSNYQFGLFIYDNACNYTFTTNSVKSSKHWPLVSNNTVSVNGGFQGLEVPNINLNISVAKLNELSYFAEQLVLSGNDVVGDGTVSKYNEYSTNYQDNIFSYLGNTSSFLSWYDHLLNLVQKNMGASTVMAQNDLKKVSGVAELKGNIVSTTGGTSKNQLLGTPNAKGLWSISGDVRIFAGSVCNAQALIFVDGNLEISPEFTNSSGKNRCIFIVSGNVTVGAGSRKTGASLLMTSTTLAGYDTLEAFIISDGTINIPIDPAPFAQLKNDGLLVKGGLIGKTVTLDRDINRIANNLQPATIINYDPLYMILFQTEFAKRDYTPREVE